MTIVSNVTDAKTKNCRENNEYHQWINLVFPRNNESGYHKDKCKKCGIVIEYDTSD